MELIKSIKQSSRGKGKGFAWTLEINTPALVGVVDAHDIGAVAASEVITLIRERWRNGQRVDGSSKPVKTDTRLLRRAQKYVMENNPSHEDYMKYITTEVDPYEGWRARLANTKRRRYLYIRAVNFNRWKLRVFENHVMRVPGGELGKKSHLAAYIPIENNPAINASGMMVDAIRGKMRKARSAKMNGKDISINEHIEIRLPLSRQRAGAWVGGLTQSKVDAATTTFRHMPETKAVMDNAVAWQQPGQTAVNALFVLRLTYRILRLMA